MLLEYLFKSISINIWNIYADDTTLYFNCDQAFDLWQQLEFASKLETDPRDTHCVKSVLIRSFSGPYFPTFELNMEGHFVSLCIQSECGKIRTKKTPNTDTFHTMTVDWGSK